MLLSLYMCTNVQVQNPWNPWKRQRLISPELRTQINLICYCVLQPIYLSNIPHQLCSAKKCFLLNFLSVGPSLSLAIEVLYITVEAKEMISRPCRVWKHNPDRTVMTKEFLGNIRVHRRQRGKGLWRLCFLSSCSPCLLLLAHQPFSDALNSSLTCEPQCRPWRWGRKFSKLVLIQRIEEGSLCWQDAAQQRHISVSLVDFQLTLRLAH